MALKIDGKTIQSSNQGCAEGECQLGIAGSVNVGTYSGGAHPAELIATDGHAEVTYADGVEAYLISAEPASDAVGTAVPTSISVSEGDILTLTVQHRENPYVYPVVAGAGWEGGFRTEIIAGPNPNHSPSDRE